MACTYSLNINGQIQQFNDYAELFDFLIGHKNQIEMGLISDIVFSQDTKQSEMAAKLRSIKATAKLNSNGVDPVSGDIVYNGKRYIVRDNSLENVLKELNRLYTTND